MTDIETSGNVNLNGTVNGIYYDSIYPEIDMNLTVFDGTLRYPGLPDELTIHELKTEIVKPEGGLNLLQFGVSNLSMQLAENPFSMHANFSSLFTDPYIDVAIDGIVDMGSLSKVIPLGDTRMQGLMEANIAVLGNYSALKNNDFSSFLSKGNVTLSDFSINNSAVPQGVKIQNASLILQNQNIEIQRLEGGIGRSDFELKGTLNNTITYLFANDILKGDFTLNSKFLDANEFMSSSTNGDTSDDVYLNVDSIKVDEKALELPDNMHLQFNATIDKILFDQMNITNFKGEIDLVNQALLLQNLSMNMIDGQLKMNGSALADGREFPYVNLDLVVRGFDLPSAHRDLSIVQKYMPFAAKSQGEFSTKLKVKSKLSKELKLVAQDVSATGSFSTKDVKLVDAVYFSNLKSVIQYEKLKNLEVDDFTARFSIKEGNLKLEPFSTKLANQPIQLKGLYNLAGTLDFRVDATLDKDILSRDIQNMIAYIPGHQNVKKVDVGLDITGQAKKPDVKVDYDKIKKQVLEQVKNSSKEDLEDAAKKLLYDLFR
jgi:Cu/Ag efflux protein CusF